MVPVISYSISWESPCSSAQSKGKLTEYMELKSMTSPSKSVILSSFFFSAFKLVRTAYPLEVVNPSSKISL